MTIVHTGHEYITRQLPCSIFLALAARVARSKTGSCSAWELRQTDGRTDGLADGLVAVRNNYGLSFGEPNTAIGETLRG